MNMDNADKRICDLIAKQLLEGLNDVERRELEEWTAVPGNRELYRRVTEREYMKERIVKWGSIDVQGHAEAFEREMGKTSGRRIGWWRVCAAVAVAIVLVGVGVGVWRDMTPPGEVPELADVCIVPGGKKAVLVLDDGRQVALDTRMADEIVERDGKVIRKDAAGIDYSRETGEEGAGLKNKIIVPTGGEYNLVLSDGTRVYLNSESKIEYPVTFTGKERVVTLEGEAYFQVTASKEHPFVVRTRDMDVLVTGTEFNVKAYRDEMSVQATLLRGTVSVFTGYGKGEEAVIRPNQQARWDREKAMLEVREVDPDLFVAWRNGRFLFRQDRLEDIMRTLARWYDVEVVFLDESIKDMAFAGKLDRSEDIMPIVNVLRATDKLTVEVKGKQIVLGVK